MWFYIEPVSLRYIFMPSFPYEMKYGKGVLHCRSSYTITNSIIEVASHYISLGSETI